MGMMIIAGLLITLPAIVIAVVFAGSPIMIPALASLAINFLPFLAAIFLLRGRKGEGDDFGH